MCARVPLCVSCVHACSQEMSAYRASLSASWLTPLFKELMSCAWRCWVCESELTPLFKELMSCVWRAWPSTNRLIPSNRGFSSTLRALESMLNIIDETKNYAAQYTENPCRPVHPHQDVSRLFCHLTMWLQIIFYHVQAHAHTRTRTHARTHARTRTHTHIHFISSLDYMTA